MQIFIQAHGFELTAALREHVERRIHFALGRTAEHIHKVSVRLSDLNGPRGGEDKRCRILVTVAAAPELLIEDIEPDLYVAIDRAADRAGRTLARQLARQREHRHEQLRVPAATRDIAGADAATATSALS